MGSLKGFGNEASSATSMQFQSGIGSCWLMDVMYMHRRLRIVMSGRHCNPLRACALFFRDAITLYQRTPVLLCVVAVTQFRNFAPNASLLGDDSSVAAFCARLQRGKMQMTHMACRVGTLADGAANGGPRIPQEFVHPCNGVQQAKLEFRDRRRHMQLRAGFPSVWGNLPLSSTLPSRCQSMYLSRPELRWWLWLFIRERCSACLVGCSRFRDMGLIGGQPGTHLCIK